MKKARLINRIILGVAIMSLCIISIIINMNTSQTNSLYVKVENTDEGRIINVDTTLNVYEIFVYHNFIYYGNSKKREEELSANWYRPKVLYHIPVNKKYVKLDQFHVDIEIVDYNKLEKLFNDKGFVSYETIKMIVYSSLVDTDTTTVCANEYLLDYGLHIDNVKIEKEIE